MTCQCNSIVRVTTTNAFIKKKIKKKSEKKKSHKHHKKKSFADLFFFFKCFKCTLYYRWIHILSQVFPEVLKNLSTQCGNWVKYGIPNIKSGITLGQDFEVQYKLKNPIKFVKGDEKSYTKTLVITQNPNLSLNLWN